MALTVDFSRLKTRNDLLLAIGIDDHLFQEIIDFTPPEGGVGPLFDIPPFLRHQIPKKNLSRGHRTVWEPLAAKSNYKALARRLESFFRLNLDGYPHADVYGYRSGRNIRENAMRHVGRTRLISLDIEDFFPSISVSRIRTLLTSAGVAGEPAELLSQFLTIDDALPPGLPTSPVISNAVLLGADLELADLARRHDASYSRYADDLSFSSDAALPDAAEVCQILQRHDFRLAADKTRQSRLGQAHYVTGLSISDPMQPHPPRAMKRRLRQELYYAKKFGLADHLSFCGVDNDRLQQEQVNRLDGTVKFVAHQEPYRAAHLKSEWNTILDDNGMDTSFAPKNQHRAPFDIFIDEAEIKRDGVKMLALCFCATQHATSLFDRGREVLEKFLADPWSDGDLSALVKKGLHYTDATEDLRRSYVEALSAMRFEGYVVIDRIRADETYEAAYLRLLTFLLPRRLMAAESQHAHLHFEVNDKVSQTAVKACVKQTFQALSVRNNRRPLTYRVAFAGKPHLGICIPDFLLGVLGSYLKSPAPKRDDSECRKRLMFERLRDKYRLIFDLSAGEEYSRRHPIHPWSGSVQTAERIEKAAAPFGNGGLIGANGV